MAFTQTEIDKMIADFWTKVDFSQIPAHMHYGVREWVEYGIPGGSFLDSVMRHDIYDAVFRADIENKRHIADWAEFMAWYLPVECHGSERNVLQWQIMGGLRGRLASYK